MTNQMFRCTFLKLILASARWLQAALQPLCPVLISAQRHRRPEYKVLQMEKTFWLYVISDLRNITDLHICVERGEIQPQSWKLLMRNRAQWGCDTRSEQIRNRRNPSPFSWVCWNREFTDGCRLFLDFRYLTLGIMDVKFNWNCKCDRKSQKIYLWWDYSDWASKHNQTEETAFCLRFD